MNKQFVGRNFSGIDYLTYYVNALISIYGRDRCAHQIEDKHEDMNNYNSSLKGLNEWNDENEVVVYKLAVQLEQQTKVCFGKSLRSKSLGSRHVDKGVYVEQLVRWFVNFHPRQFAVVPLSKFAKAPLETLSFLLRFLELPDLDNGYPKNAADIQKLKRPNNLSEIEENVLSNEERNQMHNFFTPYNVLLNLLLCTNNGIYNG